MAFLLSIVLIKPCAAAQWLVLGNAGASLDKSYIDADSIEQVDGYRIVRIMTVYPSPRLNKNNIRLDSHVQKTAFDCTNKTFFGIQTIGYLNGQLIGAGPEATDWKTQLIPVQDTFSQRVLSAACRLPVTGGVNPGQHKAKLSSGSGIIVNDEGYVLTNFHVIRGGKSFIIKPRGSQPLLAKLEAVDPKNDLALLKTVSGGYGEVAHFRAQSRPAKLGENIGVVGYPLTGILSTEPKATFGQVNSVAGMGNDYTLLQISAPVQSGNSGGPVFDAAGNVIGIVVSQASLALAAKIGAIPQNVNFAIRGEIAQIFMEAHGITFTVGKNHKNLTTEKIASMGQESTVLILCARE